MAKRIVALALVLVMLVFGAESALAWLPCGACQSTGKVKCRNCDGKGYLERGTVRTGFVKSPCSICHGNREVDCRACGGDGKIGADDPGESGGSGGSEKPKPSLSQTSLTLVAGRTATLSVSNASGKVKWSSSNKSVAAVTSKGKVRAKKNGKCTITAKVGDEKLTCKVKVQKKVYAKSIKLNKKSATLLAGEDLELSYTVSPNASKITETWSVDWSSNKGGVASVDGDGKVSAHNPGDATITARLKIKKGKYKKVKCKIAVESGLTRFRRWFNKNCSTVNGSKVYYSGDNDRIIYNPSAKTWTFYRHEDRYNGYVEESITFNDSFTGSAKLKYYWIWSGAYTGTNEVECTATASVARMSHYSSYDWTFTKGTSSDKSVSDSAIVALLSSFHLLLINEAKLNARDGWRDLGMSAY